MVNQRRDLQAVSMLRMFGKFVSVCETRFFWNVRVTGLQMPAPGCAKESKGLYGNWGMDCVWAGFGVTKDLKALGFAMFIGLCMRLD